MRGQRVQVSGRVLRRDGTTGAAASFLDGVLIDESGAPEVVRREAYGPATDVYGFALVLFELITREVSFDGWSAERVSALVALRGRRGRPSSPASLRCLRRRLRRSAGVSSAIGISSKRRPA